MGGAGDGRLDAGQAARKRGGSGSTRVKRVMADGRPVRGVPPRSGWRAARAAVRRARHARLAAGAPGDARRGTAPFHACGFTHAARECRAAWPNVSVRPPDRDDDAPADAVRPAAETMCAPIRPNRFDRMTTRHLCFVSARVPAFRRVRPALARPPKLRALRTRMHVLSKRDSACVLLRIRAVSEMCRGIDSPATPTVSPASHAAGRRRFRDAYRAGRGLA
ncbi:hypothetical protein GTC3P0254_46920 [Burkholderia pseudomallei]|nr:hypothetical protein GTC019_46030 [Burkholderia pseudomallei]BEH39475.1 hypothetical protein GTC254T_45700 [Burkholderia pseudomallei]BEH57399.1 hypothetical protein BpKM376_45780 [Burkholderia pseudomallei]BEH69544.1 hypothetical protein BpKM391_46190 [Burkholderia pseudomallei]GEA57715.1 hypothetical protein GTC3P0254_46920 [Burkholderia pseudomallei]